MEQQEVQPRPTTSTRLSTAIHVLGLLLVFLLGFAAYSLGMFHNFLFILVCVSVPVVLLVRLWGLYRKKLAWSVIRHPLRRENRPYLLQALLQWMFWMLLAVALQLAIPFFQFRAEELLELDLYLWVSVGLLVILALVPNRKIRWSTNLFFALASLVLVVELVRVLRPVPVAEAVVLDPPFRGEWYVIQGGRSGLVNHHFFLRSQRHALDIYRPPVAGQVEEAPSTWDAHPTWGQMLYAPAAGRVVKVVNDRPDMGAGKTDLKQIVGNHIVLDIGGGRFVLMAHLMHGSALVKSGDEVQSGQLIARCGNSGNTSEPHLHLQVQSDADFEAAGLRTYPVHLRGVTRRRAGHSESMESASLRRNDVVVTEAGVEGRRNRDAQSAAPR